MGIIKQIPSIIRYKIYASLDLQWQPFRAIDIGKCPLPLRASFILNNRCNARCVMCMVEDYFNEKSARKLTLDRFKVIADNLHLEKLINVTLSGGEPFLNEDISDVIYFVNQHYPHVPIDIITNGIALTRDKAEELAKGNIRLLQVSLNAGTKETYKKVMQVDCFERVVANIKYYQELCLKAKKQPSIWLSFVAHRKNIEDLIRFVELGNSLGVKLLTTSYSRFYPKEHRLRLAMSPENILNDSDSLFYHQDLSDRYFREAKRISHKLGIEFRHEPLFSGHFQRTMCEYPFSSIAVDMDGEVFPCCGGEVIFREKVSNGTYDFGNLLKQPVEEFWNNDCYKAVRYSALHPERVAIPECGMCMPALIWNGHIKKSHIFEWEGLSNKSIDFGLLECKGAKFPK